mmetsp:Transcript_26887/g.40980  ORF Transcript_26887/g.40980 Transcript_26887/m.40980 type:complete len:152 (-) Transcript_26887:111-566(-)
MSLVSDLLPIRSIIFEIGAFFSSLMLILIATSTDTTTSPPYGYMASISFLLGMFLTGAMISASIIVCDIGKFVKTKYGTESVGTLTGIIHGVASFGSVFGQLILGDLESWTGWNGVFYTLAGFTFIGGLPAISYLVFEIKQWKKQHVDREA